MKLNFLRTVLSAAVLLGLTVSAPAQVPGTCGTNSAAGEWGLTFTGTVVTPGGAVTLAAVSRVVVEPGGHLTGSQTSSLGGVPGKETFEGTITVDPDCTGKASVSVYDQSGTLVRTAKWDVLLVDRAREMYDIISELKLPNGVILPTIITGTAKKLTSEDPAVDAVKALEAKVDAVKADTAQVENVKAMLRVIGQVLGVRL